MSILKQGRVWWVLANVLGIGSFLYFASMAWIEPELADVPGAGGGDFVVWSVGALPILALFFLLHFIVGGLALWRSRSDWALPIVATTLCWIAAFIFDNAHHAI